MERHQFSAMNLPKEKKRRRRPKDPNKPKRALSGYFFFMNEYREKCKVAGKTFSGVTDFTREAAAKWRDLANEKKKPYEERSAKDKERYNNEMLTYVPSRGRARAPKDPNAPKKPMTGFFLFMHEYINKMKDDPKQHKQKVSDASEVWNKSMSSVDRQPYEDKHAELKVKYEVELAKYREEQAAKAMGNFAPKNGACLNMAMGHMSGTEVVISDDEQ